MLRYRDFLKRIFCVQPTATKKACRCCQALLKHQFGWIGTKLTISLCFCCGGGDFVITYLCGGVSKNYKKKSSTLSSNSFEASICVDLFLTCRIVMLSHGIYSKVAFLNVDGILSLRILSNADAARALSRLQRKSSGGSELRQRHSNPAGN